MTETTHLGEYTVLDDFMAIYPRYTWGILCITVHNLFFSH